MSSFFYAFSIQLLDAGRAEQNLEKLATCTIFSQKPCVKLPLDKSPAMCYTVDTNKGKRYSPWKKSDAA